MKKYILSLLIITLTLSINGCTKNESTSKDINNNFETLVGTISTDEDNDLDNNYFYKNQDLESSFQEITNLDKPSIYDAKDFDSSLRNGSVIMISKDNSKEQEVYNISMLDKFIDSFNSGKEGYVRVIKGTLKADNTFLVNKLDEYETGGKIIKSLTYDAYNELTPGNPIYAAKIVKTYSDSGVRYVMFESNDTQDNMGTTIISFDNCDVKN